MLLVSVASLEGRISNTLDPLMCFDSWLILSNLQPVNASPLFAVSVPSLDDMDFSDTPGWRGWVMTDINAVAIALSTLFISIRIYVRTRMTRNLGLDDAIATISYVCSDFC